MKVMIQLSRSPPLEQSLDSRDIKRKFLLFSIAIMFVDNNNFIYLSRGHGPIPTSIGVGANF